MQAKSRYVVVNNPKLAAQRKVFERSVRRLTQVPAAGLFPFLDGYGLYAGQCTNALSNNPGGTLPNTTLAPGAAADSHQSQAPRALDQHPRDSADGAVMPVAVPPTAAIPVTTVFIKTADGCATTYPSQTIVNNPTTGGGLASLPEPGFPYGSYKLCAQRTLSGVTTPRPRRPAHGNRLRRSTTRSQTSTVAAETAANRVDDTIVNTNANGTPAFVGQPHLSGQPRPSRPPTARSSSGSTGPGHASDRSPPHLGRARLHAHRDARGDVRGHGHPARRLHAARPLLHGLRADRRSPGRAPARPPDDGAGDPPAALAGLHRHRQRADGPGPRQQRDLLRKPHREQPEPSRSARSPSTPLRRRTRARSRSR